MKYLTETYKPQRVLKHFEDICRIPHGSGNEHNLAEHIIDLAKKHKFEVIQDLTGNILIRKPATCGNDNIPSFLLQGHMDMVCVKNEGCDLDMVNEPIKLILDDNILRADRTSLGADNAVGLCNMLAVMVADDLTHPPLELLFTVNEEIGMVGIRKFDMSQIKSRRMITMDCGDPDSMVISSAGALKSNITKQCCIEPIRGETYKIAIKGLIGGHSGIEIGKNRASAVQLIGRVINCLTETIPINIISISVEGIGNSIPKASECVIALSSENVKMAKNVIDDLYKTIRAEYFNIETMLKLNFNAVEVVEKSMVCSNDTMAISDLLLLIPYGVQKRSMHSLEWITCSSLFSVVTCYNGFFTSKFAIRANLDELKYNVFRQVQRICALCNAKLEQYDDVPAWSNNADSKLQLLCNNTYKELFGKTLHEESIHGCVEAGIISYNIPNMDIVGIAPKSRGAHTADEHLYLESMQPFWEHLVRLLKNMCSFY